MPKKKKPKPGRALPAPVKKHAKRYGKYLDKLTALRSILSGFDAKSFETLPLAKPKTEKARAARREALAKVSRTYARVKPFVHRSFKAVKPKNKADFAELKKYVGIWNFKGLRAIPVPTMTPKKTRVTFDKQHRVKIKVSKHYTEKFFRFPHMPTDADDAVEMLETMLPDMPAGIYVIASRHHFLIPTSAPRELLVEKLKEFYTNYAANSPEFVRMLFGFKWMGRGSRIVHQRLTELKTERGKARQQRRDARIAKHLAALSAMDRHFKGHRGQQLLGTPSRAAQGLPWKEKMPLADAKRIIANEKRRKLPKLSKRARATGRR